MWAWAFGPSRKVSSLNLEEDEFSPNSWLNKLCILINNYIYYLYIHLIIRIKVKDWLINNNY